MKTHHWGFVVGLSLLAAAVYGSDTPIGPTPVGQGIAQEIINPFADGQSPILAEGIKAVEIAPSSSADTGSVLRMPVYQVQMKPDHTYEDVNAAMAEAQSLLPCDLFVQEHNGRQFRELGPPLTPMLVENRVQAGQARFPLVTMAW